MLLIHGLGANTVSWLPVGQALADRQRAPVVALDLAGFGYTRAAGTNATLNRNADARDRRARGDRSGRRRRQLDGRRRSR